MKRLFLFIALLIPGLLDAQVPVALSPSVHQQFLDASGKVLAGGFVYTYQAGTTIRQDTYTDSTGVIINTWPIPLDATGAPSNGTTQTGIWLANQSYKICAYNSALVIQWCTDNVSAYQILNGVQNIVFGSVTSDPSGLAGEIGYRSDLGCLRLYTTFWDCLATWTGIQTLSNKTVDLTTNTVTSSGASVNMEPVFNGTKFAAAYPQNIYTALPVATIGPSTILNGLAKLVTNGGVSQVTVPLVTDAGGIIGVCISSCVGVGATAEIQTSGIAPCQFLTGTTAGDYVKSSIVTGGFCADAGANYPTSGQVVGRVLSTNGPAGTYNIAIFPPEIQSGALGAQAGCTNFTPVTVSNNNAQQNLMSCTIAANTLSQGSLLEVDLQGIESAAAGQTLTLNVSLGGGTACTTVVTEGIANNQPWNAVMKLFVLTSGAGGTMNMSCQYFSTASGGGVIGPFGTLGTPTLSINTTVSNTLQITEQMSVLNAGNSVTEQGLKAVIF